MPDIKTRDTVKGTIKTLDKAAVAGERMKEAYVRTKAWMLPLVLNRLEMSWSNVKLFS